MEAEEQGEARIVNMTLCCMANSSNATVRTPSSVTREQRCIRAAAWERDGMYTVALPNVSLVSTHHFL